MTYDPITKPLTYKIAVEVASHEAIIRQAYKDSVNVWTWSAGLTSMSGHKVERYIGNPQTMRRCLEVYIWALDNYADVVRSVFEGVELSEHEMGGALSFHWNTGAIARATWAKRFKAGDRAGARQAFMNYRKPEAIIPRREKERDLFFDGKWSGKGRVVEYTRLTSRHTPIWSSAVNVDVSAMLRPIIEAHT